MDDREIVAALAAGDPDGAAAAYDAYAGSIYGYCRWMLAEQGDADEAVRDTFVLAARELGRRLRDATKVRLWLYRTARSECVRRAPAGTVGAGPDSESGLDSESGEEGGGEDGGSGSREAADLRRLIRATMAALTADEREAVELSLWHDLDDIDVAAMIGVSPERAYALAGNGRRQLEKNLGALRIARTRRDACPELDELLAGHDERLTAPVLTLVEEHVAQCESCAAGKPGTLRPEALTRLLPLAEPPADLREQVLERAAAGMAGTGAAATTGTAATGAVGAGEAPEVPALPVTEARSSLAPRAGTGLAVVLAGWGQRAARLEAAGWNLLRRSPRATIATLAVLVVMAASVTLITTNDAHAARNPAASSGGSSVGTSGPRASGAGIADPVANNPPSPKRSGQAGPSAASFLAPATTSPGHPAPSKSPRPTPTGAVTLPSASASASASASDSDSPSAPPSSSPAPVRTHSASPSPTPTGSPTPTASPTPTDSPSPTASATPTDTSA